MFSVLSSAIVFSLSVVVVVVVNISVFVISLLVALCYQTTFKPLREPQCPQRSALISVRERLSGIVVIAPC